MVVKRDVLYPVHDSGGLNEEGSLKVAGDAAALEEVSCAWYWVNHLHSSVTHLLGWWSQCSLLLGPIAGGRMISISQIWSLLFCFYYCWRLISYVIIYLKLLNVSLG